MSAVVLDTSVAVDLLAGRMAPDIAPAIVALTLVTVGHLDAEVLTSLVRMQRRGTLSDAVVATAIDDLAALPVERVPVAATLLHDAWAMRHNVTMPDALYLALARSVGGRVLTLDGRLRRAAPDLTMGPEDLTAS